MTVHRVPGGLFLIPDHIEKAMFDLLKIREEPGWTGAFSRRQHPAAVFANGSRVRALDNPDTKGTVLGSVVRYPWEKLGYFLVWDTAPRTAEFVPADCLAADA